MEEKGRNEGETLFSAEKSEKKWKSSGILFDIAEKRIYYKFKPFTF